jgi:hypothetical protein
MGVPQLEFLHMEAPRSTGRLGPYHLDASCEIADANVATLPWFSLGQLKNLSIHVVIEGATADSNPTGTPVGTFRLYTADDEAMPPRRNTDADIGSNSMTAITPTGNTRLNAGCSFSGVPGSRFKVTYARTSGGAASDRLWICFTVS